MRLAVLASLLMWVATIGAAVHTPVFILHSYSQEYPWTKGQHQAFIEGLAGLTGFAVSPSVEYLDTKRMPYDASYAEQVAGHLAIKYADYRPKVIYVTDDNALLFARDHLAQIFPEVPVFFSGVNDLQIGRRLDPARITGIFENKEIAPNIELMRHIAPDIQDIVVVGDASETYGVIRDEIKQALRQHPGIRAHFISNAQIESLTAELRGRREHFVFLTTLGAMNSARGETQTLAETLAAIVASGPFTIFSMEDVYLYPGVLGGYVTSSRRQGELAAELVERYLVGTPIARIPAIEASPNEYVIDVTELHKTGLSLPPAIAVQARLINPLPTFVERHLQFILNSVYVLASLFVLLLLGSLALLMRKNREILQSSNALAAQTHHLTDIRDSLTCAQRIAGLGNWDWWLEENRLYWSEGIYDLFGVIPGEFEASYEGFMDLVYPEDRDAVDGAVQRAIRQQDSYDITHRILRPDGEVRTVRENAEIVRNAEGTVVRMTGTVLDITSQVRSDAALRESEAKLRTVIQGFPIILWMMDRSGIYLLSEGKGLESQGLKPGEVVGRSLFEQHRDHPEVLRDVRRALNGEAFSSNCWMGDIALEVHYSPLHDANGQVSGSIGVATDITERKRTEERLSFLANFDPITRLPNRSLFNDRLEHAMQQADRAGTLVALLFLDLDNFKSINDTLGHGQGDELLRQVAERLRATVRISDTVSRLGGDEFTIIVENLANEDEVTRVAGDILQQSSIPYTLQASELYVTPSIGISLYPQDGDNVQELVMNADAAMYRAKENGRNNFHFFNKEISRGAQDRLELSTLLRGALARQEFSLHYQPQVAIDDGRIIGFEALLRWHCDARGSTPPDVFIPILEETGLINSVGEWVLNAACRWAASLGSTVEPSPSIAVNLSARQFRQPDLAGSVAKALRASGLPPGRLELEITESSLLDVESHLETMDSLKKLGVRLSIDDFGTGYSSLSYLKRFPVDRLKIDASFVRDVAGDPDDAAIVTTIIGLAHNLDLRVIAEGVESPAQLEFLQAQGCDEIQGYLIARPMPERDLPDWKKAWVSSGLAAFRRPVRRTAR